MLNFRYFFFSFFLYEKNKIFVKLFLFSFMTIIEYLFIAYLLSLPFTHEIIWVIGSSTEQREPNWCSCYNHDLF